MIDVIDAVEVDGRALLSYRMTIQRYRIGLWAGGESFDWMVIW